MLVLGIVIMLFTHNALKSRRARVSTDITRLSGQSSTKWIKPYVEKNVIGRVLVIAFDSGDLAITAALKHEVSQVVAVIRNSEDLQLAKEGALKMGVSNKIEFREGNLFDVVGDEYFDTIIFNPPDSWTFDWKTSDPTTSNLLSRPLWINEFYKRNEEMIKTFLMEAKRYLRPQGRILLKLIVRFGVFLTRGITPNQIKIDYDVEALEEIELGVEKIYVLTLSVH